MKQLFTHYRTDHVKDSTFKSVCLHTVNCFYHGSFRTFAALSKHMRTFHNEFFQFEMVRDSSQEDEMLTDTSKLLVIFFYIMFLTLTLFL